MPFETINGIKTHFHLFGTLEKDLPTVIFIHGAGQSSHCWKYQFRLSEVLDHYNFIFIDLPGHGESEGTGFKSIKEYSDFLYSFRNELNIREYVLVGHSMGGRITQVSLVDHPQSAIGAVLVGTGPRIRVTRHAIELARNSFEDFADMAAENSFSNTAPLELKNEFKDLLLKSNPDTVANDLAACNEFDTTDILLKIKVPAYIITGDEEKLAPIKNSVRLKNLIDNSRMEIIKGAGHFVMLEKPDEFNKMLTNFLNIL